MALVFKTYTLRGKMAICRDTIAISLRIMAISLLIMVTLSRKMAIVCGILYVLDIKVYSSALFLGFKIAKHQSEKELTAIV